MDSIPPELKHSAPGIAGSVVALFFMRRPLFTMIGMFIGGCALAFFGSGAIASWLDVQRYEGLVGFVMGLFGMALVGKVYDTIEAIKVDDLWRAVLDWVRKTMGV